MKPESVCRMVAAQELHRRFVHTRRVRRLAAHLGTLLPQSCTALDLGCGDGELADCLRQRHPELSIEGLDVLVRPETRIPVRPFDGQTIPYADSSVDVVLLVDVLHHTDNPAVLLKEAARVARQAVLLKDHCQDGFLARPTLRFMDWVGNAAYGVSLPYNYWSERQWKTAFVDLNLAVEEWISDLRIYPWPADRVFGRKLHFVAKLTPRSDR